MFSSQACSSFHTQKFSTLSPCKWSNAGQSSFGTERGSPNIDSITTPYHLTSDKAHPKRYLACAIFSSLIFFITGIIAVYYATRSLHCEQKGYYEQALIHSRRSFSWSLATFVIALIVYLSIGLIIFIRSIDHR
ncbi:unnamed protein product [Didymodactylos carnosus]|uniref:Uncharacterized protein n=1 Tax=Didymodactylos carnosus TaxID=1234261 RepID=A0A813TF57_9BILA|nr:unnamed protein product [Didymodactylos carnosus]CAF1037140.1 unnamed protein product [Didymodactylos carnosus]CAF3596399.1 unnamed protein product [Didymodactylos carnosus]CAF3805280.1 unnamed protein product [Didymodactylos carnosus]